MDDAGALVFIAVCAVIVGFIANNFLSRPFSRWFVYGLVALPLAVVHLIFAGAGDQTGNRFPKIGALMAFLLLCGGTYYVYQDVTGFHAEDVEIVQKSIKAEFEKQAGVTVNDVKMIMDGNRRMIGVANIAAYGITTAKSCEANMGDGHQYLWSCK